MSVKPTYPINAATPNLYQRLLAITAEAQNIEKKGYNDYSKYAYVRAVDVIAEIQKLLIKHGVYVSIAELEHKRERYEGTKGNTFHSSIKCCARFVNVDCPSDTLEVEYYAVASDVLDKDIYKAKTNGLKYLFTQQFLIVTDVVVDAEEDRYGKITYPALQPIREPGQDDADAIEDFLTGPKKPQPRQCPKCGMDLLVSKSGQTRYCAGHFKKTCMYKEPND